MWETQTDRQTDSQPSVKCTDVVVSHEPLRLPTAKMATMCCMASIINGYKIIDFSVNKESCYCLIIWWWRTGHSKTNKKKNKEKPTSKLKATHFENVKNFKVYLSKWSLPELNTQQADKDCNFSSKGRIFCFSIMDSFGLVLLVSE